MSLFTSTAAGERQRRLFSGLLTVLALVGACLLSDPSQAATRNLDTAYGPVQVPNEPQRVITLDEGALDTALAAGIQPVGSVAARGGTDLPTYLQPVAGDIPPVGVPRETTLEAILSQRPDLILAPPGLEKR